MYLELMFLGNKVILAKMSGVQNRINSDFNEFLYKLENYNYLDFMRCFGHVE